eukprot:4142310-Amphidinium_carterae.1
MIYDLPIVLYDLPVPYDLPRPWAVSPLLLLRVVHERSLALMLRDLRCDSFGSCTKGLQRLMLRVLHCDS